MRASYNGYASAFKLMMPGSIPLPAPIRADMAQLVCTLGRGEVPSSTLGISTTSLLLPVSLCFNFAPSSTVPGIFTLVDVGYHRFIRVLERTIDV